MGTLAPAITVTTLSDPCDLVARTQLRRTFKENVRAGRYLHIIDLRRLNRLDSSVLGAIILALRTVREAGGAVRLVVTQAELQRILRIAGLDRVFGIYPTIDEAIAAFSRNAGSRRNCAVGVATPM